MKEIFKYLLIICLILILLILIYAIISEIYLQKKSGKKIAKSGEYKRKRFIILALFYDFPKRIIKDIFNRQDYEFGLSGLHLIVGEQGCGKSICLAYLMGRFREKYPKLHIRTNMSLKGENGAIKSWKDLVFRNNGVYGQIDVIDEIQNWFNSLESKDFPPEMFSEITQQRKQRKCIFGTSQVWERVSKPIREQTTYVYKPLTLLNAITLVRVYKPKINQDGVCDKLLFKKLFFFVHNDSIRDSYDTYKKIQVQSLKGYKTESERALQNQGVNILATFPTE